MSQSIWTKWMVAVGLALLATGAAEANDGAVAADTFVVSTSPSTNYGGLSNLRVNSSSTTLIWFDLSSLPAGTTSSQIGKAVLRLYVNRVNTSGQVSVLPVTSAWSESTVTYATIPTLGAAVASFTPTTAQQFVLIDVTSMVQGWITTPSSNFGVALTSATGDMLFDSKENDETSHVAHLDLTVVSQGPQGIPGLQGAIGTTGASGLAGAPGIPGVAGAVGASGATGATGITGAVGATGTPGPPVSFRNAWSGSATYAIGDAVSENGSSYIALVGNTGIDPAADVSGSGGNWVVLAAGGAAGATGLQGVQGTAGAIGATGLQGIPGAAGSTGTSGATGPTGATGTTGPPVSFRNAWSGSATYAIGDAVSENGSSYIALVGNTGIDPATDVSGSGGNWAVLAAQGAAGATGLPGAQGSTGATGATGPQGITGATGAAGAAGATGSTGATGTTGAAGTTGPPVSFRNAWSGSATYAFGDAVSENGSSYIALAANTGIDPATDVSGSGGHWAVLAAEGATGAAGSPGVQGATGAAGATGSQGIQGPAGSTGATGAQGIQGATGAAGASGATGTDGSNGSAATVTIGTTTTGAAGTSASVTNSGSSSAAIFNFTIPQGAVGGSSNKGIPFTTTAHSVGLDQYFNPVQSYAALLTPADNDFTWVVDQCTIPNITVYSKYSENLIVDLQYNTSGAGAGTTSLGMACAVAANGNSCTATGPVTVNAGSFLIFYVTGPGGILPTGAGTIWTAFSCS
jgi:Collagen triple helix repeat (20 copies)